MQLIDVSPAASAALTNSTIETVLKSHLFPAGFWQVGKVVRARCCVRATATNGADTLAILPRLGAAALTGTSLGGQAALEPDKSYYYGEHPIVDVFYPAAAA